MAAGTAAKLRHDTAQFVYKSHTISGGNGGDKCNPKHLLLLLLLTHRFPLPPPGLCHVSCGCPGQLPMKSLAKPNNTQSHFDFGQAAGPTKTYGKRTKKNQKRSEKERKKKKHRKGHSPGHILRRFICILFLLTNSLQIYRFSCPSPLDLRPCHRPFCHSLYYLWATKSFYMRAILVFTSMTNGPTGEGGRGEGVRPLLEPGVGA